MKALIFDTETTGLIKNSLVAVDQQPRIIEFYGELVDIETGEVEKEVDFICNPGVQIESVITRITGLSQADLDDKQPFSAHADSVCEMIGAADEAVAHNLSFDLDMVNNEFARIGMSGKLVWPKRKICTVEQTEWIKGYRLSLSALHEELFGEPFAGAHRARVDVKALTRCYLELKKRGDL